jgi:hypothetical protein
MKKSCTNQSSTWSCSDKLHLLIANIATISDSSCDVQLDFEENSTYDGHDD